MPEISIIVPVYKVERYIHRCIESILSQTFTDWELILVDDGSPDNCPAICDEYALKDTRVFVIHTENGGVSKARNIALSNVRGNFVTFCDSDDYWERNWLENLYTAISENSVDCVNAGYRCVSEHGEVLSQRKYQSNNFYFPLLSDKVTFLANEVMGGKLGWAVWTKLFKTSVIQDYRIRFCENCGNFAEDLGFTVEYTLCSNSAKSIDIVGYNYLQRKESMMQKSIDTVKLDAMNEVSKQVGDRYASMSKVERGKILFPILHFLIMNCQYFKVISSFRYPYLGKEIEKIRDQAWYRKQTRSLFWMYPQIKKIFGSDYARRILLLSNYCLHRNWKRFQFESAFYYKVVSRLLK